MLTIENAMQYSKKGSVKNKYLLPKSFLPYCQKYIFPYYTHIYIYMYEDH